MNELNVTFQVKSYLIDILKYVYPDMWTYIDTLDLEYTSKENTLINTYSSQSLILLKDSIYCTKAWFIKDDFYKYFLNNPGLPNYSSIRKFSYNIELDNTDLSDYVNIVFNVNPQYVNIDKLTSLIRHITSNISYNITNPYAIIDVRFDNSRSSPEFYISIGEDIRDYRFREIREILEGENFGRESY